MILSHSKKFVFFRNAKSGSTTAQVMLRMFGGFDPAVDMLSGTREWSLPPINIPGSIEGRTYAGPTIAREGRMNWHHATPQQLIDRGVITLEQLREYDCWAYVRDVRYRFISGCIHMSRSDRGPMWKYGVNPEMFLKRFKDKERLFSPTEIIGRSQRDWFFVGDEQVVKPVVFDNYENELRFLIDRVGGFRPPEIPKLNTAPHHTRQHIEKWKAWYAEAWEHPEISSAILEQYAEDEAFYQKAILERKE